jgi:hypothetical protein
VYPGFTGDYVRLRSQYHNFLVPPIFEGYGVMVFPVDVEALREAWEALMEKKVYCSLPIRNLIRFWGVLRPFLALRLVLKKLCDDGS